MDNIVSETRSKIMRSIKSKNTKPEVLLAKGLWSKGYRYRKHDKSLFGTPDLTFRKYKIAIFVDSEFFHGKDWESLKLRLKTRKDFWQAKIERNMLKDAQVNDLLRNQGWTVLRFWGEDVKKNLPTAIQEIENVIVQERTKKYREPTI